MIPLRTVVLYDEEHLASRTPEGKRNKGRCRELSVDLPSYTTRTRRRIRKQDLGKAKDPSTTNCLGYIQQIQTLQAENASLQRQLSQVKRKFKCPLCPHKYSRTEFLTATFAIL